MATLIGIFPALAIGILPMVVYALVLWWFDRYEKEPLGLLLAAFLWGAIPAVIFSLITELLLDVPVSNLVRPANAELFSAALVAPLAEEAFKGTALLLLLLFFRREIDSPLDGIIYGGLVGFGFAAVENVLYFFSALAQGGMETFALVAVMRALLFGLNHALFTGLIGLGLALARDAASVFVKAGAPVVGSLAGVISHSVHNASVILGAEFGWPCLITFASDWGGVLILLVVIVWTTVREQRWIDNFLDEEVERGTLSRRDYEVVSSYVERLMERTGALLSGEFRRWWNLGRCYRLATELAFNKRRLARFPDEEGTKERVKRLRERVEELASSIA